MKSTFHYINIELFDENDENNMFVSYRHFVVLIPRMLEWTPQICSHEPQTIRPWLQQCFTFLNIFNS